MIKVIREEVRREVVEKVDKLVELRCDLCLKRSIYNLDDKQGETVKLQIDKFGIAYSQLCGYYTPYDCCNIEFLMCWSCFETHVKTPKITSQFSDEESDDEVR